ncbi:MAG: 3D domain-containing protein [Planctomycetaceae bacterium]|nr:3D domain-containing protein [Planctomycetaceae bacterium]
MTAAPHQTQPRSAARGSTRDVVGLGSSGARDRSAAIDGIVTPRALAVASLVAAVLVGLGVATGRTAESSSRVERAALEARPAAAVVESPEGNPGVAADDVAATWSLHGILNRLLVHQPASDLALDSGSASNLSLTAPAVTVGAPRTFDGRPLRAVRTMSMVVTAYSPDERSCGASADGITASGYSVQVNGGCLVAADPKVLPLGSLVSVPGYDGGAVVPVLDTGGAIKGQRLDVLFATHREALEWGKRTIEVTVWEYDDGKPNGFKRVRRKDRGGV